MQFSRFIETVGRVVGMENLKRSILESPPHGILVGLIPWRRTAAELGALHAVLIDVISG